MIQMDFMSFLKKPCQNDETNLEELKLHPWVQKLFVRYNSIMSSTAALERSVPLSGEGTFFIEPKTLSVRDGLNCWYRKYWKIWLKKMNNLAQMEGALVAQSIFQFFFLHIDSNLLFDTFTIWSICLFLVHFLKTYSLYFQIWSASRSQHASPTRYSLNLDYCELKNHKIKYVFLRWIVLR